MTNSTTPAVHTESSLQDAELVAQDFTPYLSYTPWEDVVQAPTPASTKTHFPLSHEKFVKSITDRLPDHGYKLGRMTHQLSHSDNRYIGVMELLPSGPRQQGLFHEDLFKDDGGGSLLLGCRNSHDKAWSSGMISGTRVSVCSNGMFDSEVKVTHKHSLHLENKLPSLIDRALHKFSLAAKKQAESIATYKSHELGEVEANDFMIKALENGAISGSKLPKVIEAYKNPPHPEFQENNLWSMVNAFTEVLKGASVDVVMQRTMSLTKLADQHCGLAA